MGELKPKVVDTFRLNRGKISSDVENSRRFDSELWERMKRGEEFDFDKNRGFYNIPDEVGFEFPMCEYLLSKEEGLSISEILGSDVRIVTQRNFLKDMLYQIISLKKIPDSMQIHCERFGNVIFIKQNEKTKQPHPQYMFLDKRRQFFTGGDLPGCVGSTPVEGFRFPDVGKAYSVLSLEHGNSKVLYTCTIHHFSPEGQTVDSTLVQYDSPHQNPSLSNKKLRGLLIKAATDGFDHHAYFMRTDDKVEMEFHNTEKHLREQPIYSRALRRTLNLLLDEELLSFLSERRCCKATLKWEPYSHFEPEDVDRNYRSFLPKEFFMRFFDTDC